VRRLVYIFLFLILPLHAFALQSGWSPTGKALDIAHEIDHHQGNSHHHDEDGSIHYDDSVESTNHLAEPDCCQQSASMPPPVLPLLSFPSPSNTPPRPTTAQPQRFPECLQRPPAFPG
jgi:hypothetical protein